MHLNFDQHFSLEALTRDYQALLDCKFDFVAENSYLLAGSDRLNRRGFEKQLNQHLRAIHRKVLQDRWDFSPLLERIVPKPSGGYRVISIATIRDTLVQRALHNYLYPIVDPLLGDCCVAYRRRLGAHEAVSRIRRAFDDGFVHVLDADIKAFFDSLDHTKFLEKLHPIKMDPRAHKLVEAYISTPRVLSSDVHEANAADPLARYPQTIRSVGLPQGGVISGMLANLFLTGLDEEMGARNDIHVRYADDFLVCCRTAGEANSAYARAQQALDTLRLNLHPDKTQVSDASTGVDFVGFRLAPGCTRIRAASISKFKREIRKVIDNHNPTKRLSHDICDLARRLSYRIEGPVNEIEKCGLAEHPYRRSWIGFYRIVDDEKQIKNLDNWIRKQVSLYAWQAHRKKITARDMQAAKLPSLYGAMWKARRPTPKVADVSLL